MFAYLTLHQNPYAGLELVDGRYSGEVAQQFDELDKRDFALSVAAELGVDLKRCVTVGDGRSDVPLFAAVGLAIAVNATPTARAAAHTYQSTEPPCGPCCHSSLHG